MLLIRSLILLLCILGLASCNVDNGGASDDNLPVSNGGVLDVIVVAKASVWQNAGGELFRKYFTSAQVGLPQPEATFTVRQLEPGGFNSLLKRSRNIVLLEKGNKNFKIRKNVWAKPQVVVNISAPDEASLANLVMEHQKKVAKEIKDLEIAVIQKRLSEISMTDPEIFSEHHVDMDIPRTYDIERQQDDLLVLWNRTLKTDQGIIVYFKPLEDELTTLGSEILPLRDSITRLYIHGEPEGSYMTVEDMVLPQIVPTEVDEVFAMETRGLWRVEGDFKGGPFINLTVYDEKHNQLIFLDGFVFSPQTKKRNFLLEVEAILRTLEIED